MNNPVEAQVIKAIERSFGPYVSHFAHCKLHYGDGEIEIHALERGDTSDMVVLRLSFNHNTRRIYIPNIFLPRSLYYKNIGKTLIADIFTEAAANDYSLYIVGLTPSFYRRLVNRGAEICEEGESVRITESTKLRN